MEDKIKVLETKLKLTKDILSIHNTLHYNLKELSEAVITILNLTRDNNSTEEERKYTLNKEQQKTLEELLYTAKANDLTCGSTKQYIKDYAREKEILNGL